MVSADRQAINFVVPDIFPMVGTDCAEEGILVLDEVSQAATGQQKICANLVRERNIHGHYLKEGWDVISTGNRTQDRAGANRLLSHFSDRATTLEFDVDATDWMRWAMDHGIREEVMAFINFRPGRLSDFDPARPKNATPRGWAERVSPVIGNVPKAAEFECFKGAVGEGAAAEFSGFLDIYRKLPNPDAVLMDPERAPVPEDGATLYAISGAVSYRATVDNFDRVMIYANRLPVEFTVLTVRDAVRKDPMVVNTRAFMDWAATKGADVLM